MMEYARSGDAMTADDGVIGVVGAGVMGAEIAQGAAAAGLEVLLRDIDRDLVQGGLERIQAVGERRVAHGRLDDAAARAALTRVRGVTDDADLAACGVVVETVTEVLAVKRILVRRLDATLPPGTILASNTSALSITDIGRHTGRPDRFVGLHFFNPASVMDLVEVVPGADTSHDTLTRAVALVRSLGKTPLLVRDTPGFLVTRILLRAVAEAHRLTVELGADRSGVDAAVIADGPAPRGPFALADMVGPHPLERVRRGLEAAYGPRFADAGLLARDIAGGHRAPVPDSGPITGGDAGAPGPDEHAVAVAYYAAAADEARRCLDDGVTPGAGDVDMAMRLGAGWMRGPLG